MVSWEGMLRMARKDYYRILGVSRGASLDEIRKAYRTLARRHHPDRNEGDPACEERLKEINEAYSVLGDPEKKKAYDADPWVSVTRSRVSAADRLESSAARGAVGLGPWAELVERLFHDPFVDGVFFGPRGHGRRPETVPQRSFGGKRNAGAKGPSVEVHLEVAASCLERGEERWISYRAGDRVETVLVKIPPGAAEGTVLRMAGRGADSPYGGPPGDLYVVVHVVPDE
ncbi:DnaJ domain-containing protein [Desulfosoma sp.]